jgi:hypothetical protein
LEQLTKTSTVTILNTLDKNISVVKHEIISSHASRRSGAEESVNSVICLALIACVTLFSDVGSRFLNELGAGNATLFS